MSDWAGAPEQEIETLREMVERRDAENEALRGRVAELEAGYTKLCNSASLTRKILQDSARREGVTNITAHANWGHLDTAEHEDTIIRSDARPWLLRKQAEAVEGYAPYMWPPEDGYPHLKLFEYVKRLRQQADELEAGGGDG